MLWRKLLEEVSAAYNVLRLLYTWELFRQVILVRNYGRSFRHVEVWGGFEMLTDGGEVNSANEANSVAWMQVLAF